MKRSNPEYKTLYLLKNKETGNFIFNYRASSQLHKAVFSKYEHASDAARNISEEYNVEIEIVAVDSPKNPNNGIL